jgi:hypothetical protein
MIFYWLAKLARTVRWLFVAPQARDVAHISHKAACPVCGTRENVLRCVVLAIAGKSVNGNQQAAVQCEHTCEECGARWYESPVAKVSVNSVFPAIPRDDIERAADKQWERTFGNVVQ